MTEQGECSKLHYARHYREERAKQNILQSSAQELFNELELALKIQQAQDSEKGIDADFVDDWKKRASALVKKIKDTA